MQSNALETLSPLQEGVVDRLLAVCVEADGALRARGLPFVFVSGLVFELEFRGRIVGGACGCLYSMICQRILRQRERKTYFAARGLGCPVDGNGRDVDTEDAEPTPCRGRRSNGYTLGSSCSKFSRK